MIGIFPEPYPDELVYSVLARYAVYTGYTVYRSVAEDLFKNRLERPSVEFLNGLTDDAFSRLTAKRCITDMIHKHTMFDYYARFAPTVKRQALMQVLSEGDIKSFANRVSMRTLGVHYIRYCPICAQEDRERYGETYWHRKHQMPEITICPLHHCQLHDSETSTSSKTTPSFVPAEIVIPPESEVMYAENPLEIKLAEYVASVFDSSYNMDTPVSAGTFLRSRLEGTKYCSPRGEACRLTLLHGDIQSYYKECNLYGYNESWQLSKSLTGHRHNFFEVCLLAMFLDVPPKELSDMKLSAERQHERFDRLAHELRAQGLKSPVVGKILGASYNVIKGVWYGAYNHKTTV